MKHEDIIWFLVTLKTSPFCNYDCEVLQNCFSKEEGLRCLVKLKFQSDREKSGPDLPFEGSNEANRSNSNPVSVISSILNNSFTNLSNPSIKKLSNKPNISNLSHEISMVQIEEIKLNYAEILQRKSLEIPIST